MSTNTTAFPPSAVCFVNSPGWPVDPASSGCSVTSEMVSFLNLTNKFNTYFQAYCLSPPSDDGCPYGFCPNPDIAGPLVRIAAYLTNLFVAILIFYHPNDLKESFWSQILTVYSLLITCGISIIQKQLTRIHAILAVATAGSPLSLYIVVYAIRSTWTSSHRLAPVVGRGRIIPRTIVLTALTVWIALVIYILLPHSTSRFSQESCDEQFAIVKYFFFLPIVIFSEIGSVWAQWIVTLPIQLTILAWVAAILLRRKEIWPPGERYTFRFWTVWRVISDNYPFIQFCSIVFIPFAYWVSSIEVGVLASNDDYFSASFGQVLAMFVTIPPMIQVAGCIPQFFNWFSDLAWVRLLTCRPQVKRVASPGIPLVSGDFEDDAKHKYPLSGWDERGTYNKVELIREDK